MLRDDTLSHHPHGSTIFHVRTANEFKERKRSVCFPGPFSHLICRYRHNSEVPGERINAISSASSPALFSFKEAQIYFMLSTGPWSMVKSSKQAGPRSRRAKFVVSPHSAGEAKGKGRIQETATAESQGDALLEVVSGATCCASARPHLGQTGKGRSSFTDGIL